MDRLVYTALSGLKGQMDAQATIANNIANASTIGFRADRVNFERLMVKGDGHDSRQPSAETVVDMDRRAGAIVSTGRGLDVAITGDNWLAVQAADGSEAYTRRGDLRIAPSGVLETGDGFPVMGSGGPITVPPHDKIMIADDGTISIVAPGADPSQPPQVIDQLKLVSDQGSRTVKGLDNLLHVRGGGALPADLDARVQTGALEQSNVDMVEEMVNLISAQRSYEINSRVISSADEMLRKASEMA